MYYKVMMEAGHMGAGKSYDMTRYFEADSLGVIFSLLDHFPRLKSKGVSRAVKLIEPVAEEEYLEGKEDEQQDPYLMRH